MEMKREEDLENNEAGPGEEEKEDDVCPEENQTERDMLIVTMNKTNISVVTGRGCDSGTCQGCHETGCTFNDVVMVTESSTVTLGE